MKHTSNIEYNVKAAPECQCSTTSGPHHIKDSLKDKMLINFQIFIVPECKVSVTDGFP